MTNIKTDKILNVPTLRFPGFTDEWQKKNLDELLEFYSTNSLSWEQLKYDGGDIFNLHYGLIHVGLPTLVDSSKYNLPTIKKEEFLPRKYELVKEGDVAFADASEDTNEVAKAIEFTNTDGNQIVCGLHTIHARDKANSTVVGFKGFYFSSPAFHNQVRKLAQGTKIFSVSTKILSECSVSLPSKDEQTKIANLLSLLDERIELQSKLIYKLQSLIKGLNQQLLTKCDSWNTYQLKDIALIKSGYSGTQINAETPFKVSRIETISQHYIDMQRIGYVQEVPKNYKLNIGDILFSNINSVQYIGNTAYIDKEYDLYHGMNLLRIVPNATIVLPRFLHLLFCTRKAINHFQTICNKAVSQASINQTDLGKSQFAIPTMETQHKICQIFEGVKNKIENEQLILIQQKRQKESLLKQLFI